MSKTGLIIKREYTTRVRKRSFIVISLLGPLLFAGIIFSPLLIANSKNENRRIVVVDETKIFCGQLTDNSTVHFDYGYCNFNFDEVNRIFKDSSKVSVLYIKKSETLSQVELHSKSEPGADVLSEIRVQLNNYMLGQKMSAEKIDPTMMNKIKTNIDVKDYVGNKVSNSDYNMVLAYVCSFLIYIFIFLYSVQVMRGVMEEKINRIVEIIISSVRPFQLMMGKVIGVGLIGLTQFLIWVILCYGAYKGASAYFQGQEINPKNALTEQTVKQGMSVQNNAGGNTLQNYKTGGTTDLFEGVDEALSSTDWVLVLGSFLFFFLGGYMLYSSLFAAVGSAVDQETETQQFMLPVTAPLVLSIIVMQSILTNPHSNLAVWFSLIPFTSPIAMMARIPFGVPAWQVWLSAALLIASIFGTIWLAGRIYRVGLLMYGKKVTYRELGKWLFYK